jgi:glutathione peroxidase
MNSRRQPDGERVSLEKWRGHVLLIVNTASQCGFTPQYADCNVCTTVEPHGLTVLGFPCNQFGAQEPGTEAEIAVFCRRISGPPFPSSPSHR